MLKIIILLLTIFFLSGCRSFDRKVICAQLDRHQVKPHEICDISFKNNRCRCREFDFNNWESLGPAVDHELDYCEGVAGFRLEDIANDIRPNVKALANIKANLCLQ